MSGKLERLKTVSFSLLICFSNRQFFTLRASPPAHFKTPPPPPSSSSSRSSSSSSSSSSSPSCLLPLCTSSLWEEWEEDETEEAGEKAVGGERGSLGALSGLSLGSLGALLGCSWGSSGGSGRSIGAILEAIDQNRVWHLLVSPRRGPKSRLLGPTWAALGALLGALGPVFGLSGACLGALLGHLGAILRPQESTESEKARRPKTLIFLRCLKDFCLSGASLGGSAATWSRLGAILEPLVGMLGAILSHRGLS